MFTKIPTSLQDCFLIESQVFGDSRGFFMETYSSVEFEKIGITANFVQDNHSKSKKGVLRGLHFQTRKPQAKLVRVTAGSVYDVVVDVRRDSPTFGKWEGFLLSEENKRMLFVPRGFAHGFLTLEDDTEFLYKCDDVYDPGYEGGLTWDDQDLKIDWQGVIDEYGISGIEISEKDKKNWKWSRVKNVTPFLFGGKNPPKNWTQWMVLKEKLHQKKKTNLPKVSEGDIWWMHMGENIGEELNGKGKEFLRPVLVFQKFSQTQCLVVPLSTQAHTGEKFIPFRHKGRDQYACLHQARMVYVSRFKEFFGTIDDADAGKIYTGFHNLYNKNTTDVVVDTSPSWQSVQDESVERVAGKSRK